MPPLTATIRQCHRLRQPLVGALGLGRVGGPRPVQASDLRLEGRDLGGAQQQTRMCRQAQGLRQVQTEDALALGCLLGGHRDHDRQGRQRRQRLPRHRVHGHGHPDLQRPCGRQARLAALAAARRQQQQLGGRQVRQFELHHAHAIPDLRLVEGRGEELVGAADIRQVQRQGAALGAFGAEVEGATVADRRVAPLHPLARQVDGRQRPLAAGLRAPEELPGRLPALGVLRVDDLDEERTGAAAGEAVPEGQCQVAAQRRVELREVEDRAPRPTFGHRVTDGRTAVAGVGQQRQVAAPPALEAGAVTQHQGGRRRRGGQQQGKQERAHDG